MNYIVRLKGDAVPRVMKYTLGFWLAIVVFVLFALAIAAGEAKAQSRSPWPVLTPIHMDTALVRQAWDSALACTGTPPGDKSPDKLTFFSYPHDAFLVVETGYYNIGYFLRPSAVLLDEAEVDSISTVAHELTHYLQGEDGDHPLTPWLYPCHFIPTPNILQGRGGG